ncbi:MAG: hypothetical protein ACPGU1_19680 [Myxococcota bacterium]
MLSTRTAIAALTTLAALAAPLIGTTDALASAKKGKALKHTGYRILIEPEVTESSRKHRTLTTKSITWKLRSVYVDNRGKELLVTPRSKRRPIKDITISLNRAWRPTDVRVQTRNFSDLKSARRRFSKLIKSARANAKRRALAQLLRPKKAANKAGKKAGKNKRPNKRPITRNPKRRPAPKVVIGPAMNGPKVIINPKATPGPMNIGHMGFITEITELDGPQAMPSCREAVTAQGHHPMFMSQCKNVEQVCAVTLLEAGYHPQLLSNCAPNLSQRCTTELLAHGHHPQLLGQCAGVEESCAVSLLSKGQHPHMLDYCE